MRAELKRRRSIGERARSGIQGERESATIAVEFFEHIPKLRCGRIRYRVTRSSVKTLCCQIKPLVFQAEICPQQGFDVASSLLVRQQRVSAQNPSIARRHAP